MGLSESDIQISDVVISVAGRDKGQWYYVAGREGDLLMLVNGSPRALDRPKRKKVKHVEKVLRSETRVAAKLLSGDKVLNGELRRDLAFLKADRQSE